MPLEAIIALDVFWQYAVDKVGLAFLGGFVHCVLYPAQEERARRDMASGGQTL